MIAEALFGENPRLFCDIAEWNGEAGRLCGLVLNFSTFAAATASISKTCSCARRCAATASARRCWCISRNECVANGWSQLQWAVLDWNAPSIAFYKSLGAVMMDEWTLCRLTGPALAAPREGRAMMEIVLIVAVAENGVIGADDAIPWRLKIRHAALQGA